MKSYVLIGYVTYEPIMITWDCMFHLSQETIFSLVSFGQQKEHSRYPSI